MPADRWLASGNQFNICTERKMNAQKRATMLSAW